MIVFKIIFFILAIALFIKAILDKDFDDLFLAIFLFFIALGIQIVK